MDNAIITVEKATVHAEHRGKSKCHSTPAERFYAFTIIMSLVWQFCIIIYDFILSGPLSLFVTVADIVLWFVAWLLMTIEKKKVKQQIKLALPTVVLFGILGIKYLVAGNFSDDYFAPSRALYQIYSLIYALLWGTTIQILPSNIKRKILFWFYIMLTVTVIPSYFYVRYNTDALRDGGFYGHVDFQYIYAMIPLLGLTIVTLLRGNTSGKLRIAMICMLVSNTGIILLSNFATAMVLVCISLLLGLIFTKKMRFKKIIFIFAIFALCIFLFKNIVADIVMFIQEGDLFGDVMKRRLYDIAKLLRGDGVGWSFEARIILMEGSWHSFLSHPIFGVPFNYSGRNVLGFHETWLTLLGYGGLVGFVCVLVTLKNFFCYQSKTIKNTYFMNAYLSILLVVLILSFLNPVITKSNLMITLGIMPMLSCCFGANKQKIAKEK